MREDTRMREDTQRPVVELQGVGRIHGSGARAVTALDGIDLTVAPGEFLAVMGPSGSGKSTLLNLAGALDRPTTGRVIIAGRDLAGLDRTALAEVRRRAIGFVFQDFNLLPSLTAAENVAFPLELDGWPARRARAAALTALEQVGLSDLADRLPDDMSGGQAQRAAIARAIVGPRRLLLADEPTGALDSTTGTAVIGVLRQRADDGVAVLMVTHEPRFAAWADRTVFLRDGRMVGSSGPADADELLSVPGEGR
ncbi:ABC transporter ATP-binding protein [Actinomyces ruminicola]|uniref:Putative ABC transport system ATP-binding protein n=1 Tax=Actinomyces ruminicola TaxID=332524 RepID=A0A1G9RQL9_9ACTO|nr:ABC transporter ATP-binding protein [Actinomyces ruminicola]SDM25486.1 putative ABC transport system ATP-binding protein [Actinomyces ruminicola]